MNIKVQYVVLVVLVSVFIALLVLSAGLRVNKVESIFPSVEVPLDETSIRDIKIGTVHLENKNLLPSKVTLKKYFVCFFSEPFGSDSYETRYKGTHIQREPYHSPFEYSRRDTVELSRQEALELDLVISNSLPKDFFDENKDRIVSGKTFTAYLYTLEKPEYWGYDYCDSKRPEDALREIPITFTTAEHNENAE